PTKGLFRPALEEMKEISTLCKKKRVCLSRKQPSRPVQAQRTAPACRPPLFSPHVINMVSMSLATGSVPNSFKQAVLSSILKKRKRNQTSKSEPKNYRPVSKLALLSKIMDKVVAKQLRDFLHGCKFLQ
uniref:Reverse transcriptase domain-containing protein n=1 Tax=Periophthalmus magnuspinnatus TaxID=409849 RepID=A0A3B3ZWE9_9GOBI